MRVPARPDNEQARLHSLYELEVLDRDNTAIFDGAVEMASQITGCPIALISLVDADRQWFAAARNLDATETGRDVSFCGHAILGSEVLVVPDARVDARFHDNPLVTADPSIVFYAGAPLVMPDGATLGTVCVIDREPRYLSERQTRALAQLSRFVVDQLELRRSMLRLERQTHQQVAEHQRQSDRLSALGRDLEQALDGVTTLLRDRLGAESLEDDASLKLMMDSVRQLRRISVSIGESGMAALDARDLTLTPIDLGQLLRTVLEAFAAELASRDIALELDLPEASVEVRSDRERLRFLCFHMIGTLLSPSGNSGRLVMQLGLDGQSGVEISASWQRQQAHGATDREIEDLALLDTVATSLQVELTTLLDEAQQRVLRIRLPLEP